MTNERFLISPLGEEYLYSINRNSFEKESSHSIFSRLYDEKLEKEHTFYLVLGTDSGLLLKHLLEQKKPDDTQYLFIELPEVIEQISQKFDFEELPEHIAITTIDKWKEAGTAFGLELYLYKNKTQFIKSVAAIDSYLPAYNDAILKFEQEFQSFRFFTRATLVVSPFMDTQLKNICENRTPASVYKDKFRGDTCVILAGGPSLDEDIKWVKENREHLIVIAVSRIAKRLNQIGLVPHIVVSVDPFEISFDVSKELLLFPPDVLFLHTNNVTPLLLGQWHGKSAYMDRRYPWDVENDKNNIISNGPTVTNAALKAAIDMGFSHILLSGVDLCFSEKGISHATGSNEAKIGPTLGQTGKWVETYSGKIVETLVVFEQAAKGFSGLAKQAQEKDIQIFNLSANAAKVPYISHMPTVALSFSASEINYTNKITSYLPNETNSDVIGDFNTVNKQIKKTLTGVKKIKILANEALTANDNLFKEKGKESENFKFKLQMDKIEKKLNSTYKKTSTFVKNFGIDKFIKSAQTKSSDEWSDKKVENTGRLYYQAYVDTCDALIKHLDSTIERVNCRIEEHNKEPDFSILFKQWAKDKAYGRAGNWLKSDVQNRLVDTEKAQFLDFKNKFEDELYNEETKHLKRTKHEASLKGVRRKIITLFHQKNTDALSTLCNSLELHMKADKQAKPLYHLALAYHSIAIGDEHEALRNFESLPDESILEDELQQITAIAFKLENYSLAKACLEKLTSYAGIYIPQYAKLLKLLGEPEEAINCYINFLNKNPDDLFIWNNLGVLYYELNIYETSKLAFETTLSKDKDNQQAQDYLKKLSSIE